MQNLSRPTKYLALSFTTALLCLTLNSAAVADNTASPISGPWSSNAPQNTWLLAQASSAEAHLANAAISTNEPLSKKPRQENVGETPEAPWYGRNNVHKYLGLGSLGAAALTVLSPKGYDGPHEMFANAAAALGGAAIVSGIYSHWDDLDFSWQDPDTKHAMFGVLGTLGYLLAVSLDGKANHAAAGSLGALSMIASIKYTW